MRTRVLVVCLSLGVVAGGCVQHGLGRIQPGSDVKLPLTTRDAAKAIAANALACAARRDSVAGQRGMLPGESCVLKVDSARVVTPRSGPQRVP